MAQKQKIVPTLEDPDNIREIYASEVVVVALGDGALRLTLAIERNEPITPKDPLRERRIVVARLVLGEKCGRQLLNNLEKLASMRRARNNADENDNIIN